VVCLSIFGENARYYLQVIVYRLSDLAVVVAIKTGLSTRKVWVRFQASACGVCGGQGGTTTGFS
jgi:hypothetical protein